MSLIPSNLHNDNAASRTPLRVREFLAKHSLEALPQHPYSPDPADFILSTKTGLKGLHLGTIEAIQTTVTVALN